jgi:hypothetical protein
VVMFGILQLIDTELLETLPEQQSVSVCIISNYLQS